MRGKCRIFTDFMNCYKILFFQERPFSAIYWTSQDGARHWKTSCERKEENGWKAKEADNFFAQDICILVSTWASHLHRCLLSTKIPLNAQLVQDDITDSQQPRAKAKAGEAELGQHLAATASDPTAATAADPTAATTFAAVVCFWSSKVAKMPLNLRQCA